MTRRVLVAVAVAVALGAVLAPAAAQAQATRTWVSGGDLGNDVNPCSRTSPCKTFAGAISKTAAGGEINTLDAGGYGAVTITKPITIDGSGYQSGILHSATNGVIVNVPDGGDVVLRGLTISGAGTGSAACPNISGIRAVWLRNAGSLRIEDTRIVGTTTAGLDLSPEAGDAQVLVDGVGISEGCQNGINASPVAGRKVDVMVRNSTIFNTATGVRAAAGAHVWLAGSTIFGNGTGLLPTGGGLIDDLGGNQIVGNGVNGVPSNVLVAPPAVDIPTVPPTPKPKPKCKVPKLSGFTLAEARKRLKTVRCALGKVTAKTTTKRKRNGRISAQRTKAGTQLAAGAKVPVTVWRLTKR